MASAQGPTARTSTIQLVKTLVQPYTASDKQPPFTHVQLMAIALCLSGSQQTLTFQETMNKIIALFPTYRQELLRCIIHRENCGREAVIKPFELALRGYEMPLTVTLPPKGAYWQAVVQANLSITESGVRHALSNHLLPLIPSGGIGHVPDIRAFAPEIRNMIYTYLLTFPASGIRPRRIARTKNLEFQILSRNLEHTATLKDWIPVPFSPRVAWEHSAPLHSAPTATALAILWSDPGILREASSLFYSLNKFVVHSLDELERLLTYIPTHGHGGRRPKRLPRPERLAHMRSVAFVYTATHRKKAKGLFEVLAGMPKLEEVGMWFDRMDWVRYMTKGARTYTSPATYDGVDVLVLMCETLRMLSLEGNCEDLAKYLKKEIRPGAENGGFRLLLGGREVVLGGGGDLEFKD